MKIWCLTHQDGDSASGTVQTWFTSKRAAEQEATRIARDDEIVDFFVHKHQGRGDHPDPGRHHLGS